MTRKQYRQKTHELITETAREMREKADILLATGAIDLASHSDNYQLPQAVVSALCIRMGEQWRPLTDEYRKEAKNISHFI